MEEQKSDQFIHDWCWLNNRTDKFDGFVGDLFASRIIAIDASLSRSFSLGGGSVVCSGSFVFVTSKTLIKRPDKYL